MRIHLVRHGESEGNVKLHDYSIAGDHQVKLTARGIEQAQAAGQWLSKALSQCYTGRTLLYRSPYHRTRQTLNAMLNAANIHFDNDEQAPPIYEDPRLREVEHGYGQDVDDQEDLRRVHGFFYYRYRNGESPADCYDRMCTFTDSMHRQVARKGAEDVVIVSHGLTIRCFVMRFLKLSPEQFDSMANPKNCAIITIDRKENLLNPVFTNGRWGVTGIQLREPAVVEVV